MLVGGLGSNQYLYRVLKKQLKDESKELYNSKSIEVHQPHGDRPWTAVCRGAVLRGLSEGSARPAGKVEVRKSRLSYGIRPQVPFDPKIHSDYDKWQDPQELGWVTYQMDWYLKRVSGASH
jgi:hypothetical protein